jgi:uncharacterized protein (DUF1778 family)
MDLTPYVEGLRRDLLTAAAAGTDDTRRTADLLTAALDPAVRLAILDALSAAMADVTAALPGVTVELRMHGREPRVAVDTVEPEPASPPVMAEEADGTARVTLRLPESVKARTEDAAGREGVSVNSWLVRAVVQALDAPRPGSARAGRRITGYARG